MLPAHRISKKVIYKLFSSLVLEFGPLVLFLLAYDFFYVYKATFVLMIATIISTMIIYRSQKRLPYAGLYVAMLTILFGYLTLMYRNPHFIQMRDTVFDATNALLLLGGLMFDYLFLKTAFQDVAPMANKGWRILTYAWISFFFFAALANEYVRHHFFLKQWVTFKTSMIAITMVFGCIAIFFSYIKQGDGKD